MKAAAWMLLLLTVAATFMGAQVMAEDVEEDVEVAEEEEAGGDEVYEEEEYEEEAPEVTTRFYFPDNQEKRFAVGKDITVLVDFQNNGAEDYNISKVAAFLHSPFDFNYYIQNFTVREVSGYAPGGSQISLEYTFKPDATLEPLEFWLSGFVEYNNSDDQIYYSTFINGTIELVEEGTVISVSTFFSYFMGLGAVGFAAYIAVSTGALGKGKSKRKGKSAPRVAESTSDDWDVDAYKQSATQKPRKRGGKTSKK